jgi:hypothetical protein
MTTKNLIPRASGEGGIGITDVTWGYGYYDTGNFNKGLFVSGHNITQVIAETVTQGGLGGEWTRNGLDIYYNGGNVGIGTTDPNRKIHVHTDTAVPQQISCTSLIGGLALSHATMGHGADLIGDLQLSNAVGNLKVFLTAEGKSYFNGGNVGIGTTNPGARLDVSLSSNSLATSKFYNAGGSAPATVHVVDEGDAADHVGLFVGSDDLSSAVLITKSDKVGIGTPDPVGKLHIFDNTVGNNESSALILSNYDYGLGETGQSVSIEGRVRNDTGGDSPVSKIVFGKDSDFSEVDKRDGNIQFHSMFGNNGTAAFAERMRITSLGNVGIGTTNPSVKLDILGSFKLNNPGGATLYPLSTDVYKNGTTASLKHSAIFNTGGWRNATVIESVTGTTPSNFSTQGLYLNSTYGSKPFTSASIQVNCSTGNGDISFMTGDGSAAPTSKIKLQYNGNVGIGTTSPAAKLHVAGNLKGDGKINTGQANTGYDASGGATAEVVLSSVEEDAMYLITASRHVGQTITPTFATGYVVAHGSGSNIFYFSVINGANITIAASGGKVIATNGGAGAIVYLSVLRLS